MEGVISDGHSYSDCQARATEDEVQRQTALVIDERQHSRPSHELSGRVHTQPEPTLLEGMQQHVGVACLEPDGDVDVSRQSRTSPDQGRLRPEDIPPDLDGGQGLGKRGEQVNGSRVG